MKKGGFLFPGGNATTPVPAIQVTPREEKPQQKAYVAPIERGGLLLPGGNPVMNSSSTSNNQLATATQSQPDTTPNPKPKENLQKKELDRILRTQERQRNNQPQPLRESPRSQPGSVQRPPQARDRDETLGGPSRMNVVTRSQAALREAVRVASTSSAIAHEAEKQETRDEKE
ncbi:hypothetical protein BGZ61DRAFT_443177 [Ilyonectria robusta]|uniref:uncharacterized protein n=1 Tax=Ilyonectria robusta TaxID=1079257 RepID=UPI001E8EB7B8|nr:uncharacterized protein BGZ61DRAFT_443177 [Ilyonectria robusta]KAH8734812.1 hypothetical protein BGZ61DRAFT_443177 [Ilyonectria robusta]